jgi:hypothetical protein
MKKLVLSCRIKLSVLLLTLMTSPLLFGQDEKKVDVDINVGKESNWYAQPWVWVVGGAVFVLLLVALLRGSGSRAKE